MATFNENVLGMHTAITSRYRPYQRSIVAPSKSTAISRVSIRYKLYNPRGVRFQMTVRFLF